MNKILVVDDERAVRYSFERAFREEYMVVAADSGPDALEKMVKDQPDIVLMDIKMPGMSGLEALKRIRDRFPGIPVIMMTAFGDTDTAIEAMQECAYDYVTKPFENSELRRIIEKGIASRNIFRDAVCLGAPGVSGEADRIVGKSAAILNVCKLIGKVAHTDAPVLLSGETGVGKELIARAIHTHSNRKGNPFVAVNCAALPDTLVESELFGYEQGAFTGAEKRRIGRFEQCGGGTIFLDEIGDMSIVTQSKVLRILQDSTFERLGGNETIKANSRVIAATNKNLQDEVRVGRFRSDLFHRLNVVSMHVPPLRERSEDIPILTEYFITKANRETGHAIKGISPETLNALETYSWPGNVRELENAIRRAVIMAKGTVLAQEDIVFTRQDLARGFRETVTAVIDDMLLTGQGKLYYTVMEEVERTLIKRALDLTRGNQVKASSLLGITRVTLRKKIEDYKIQFP